MKQDLLTAYQLLVETIYFIITHKVRILGVSFIPVSVIILDTYLTFTNEVVGSSQIINISTSVVIILLAMSIHQLVIVGEN